MLHRVGRMTDGWEQKKSAGHFFSDMGSMEYMPRLHQ